MSVFTLGTGTPETPGMAAPPPDDPHRLGWGALARYGPASARVLVVDDDPDVRRSLERLLARQGHDVRTAPSAEEADHWLASGRFELLLLDIDLPGMSGAEFLDWAIRRDPEMAVIMISGIDDSDLALRCLERGARTYLVKPPEERFLSAAVRDALAVRRLLVGRNRSAAGG